MKYIITTVVAILIAFTNITNATIVGFDLDGHVSATYASNTDPHEDSVHTGDVGYTVWPIITVKYDAWAIVLGAQLDIIGVDEANWLKNAFVRYQPDDEWQFNLGRISTSSIMTTMPLRMLETVTYQDWGGTGIYGYGGQVVYKEGRWTTMFDIVADSDRSFQTRDNFDGIEFGLRVQYQIDDHWTVAGNLLLDYGDNDRFTAVDVAYKNGNFGWHLVGFSDLDEMVGCYTLATYKILESVEIHGGFDIRDGQNPNTVVGMRYLFDEKTDITIDWQNRPSDNEEDVFLFRVRHRL